LYRTVKQGARGDDRVEVALKSRVTVTVAEAEAEAEAEAAKEERGHLGVAKMKGKVE
jgi:hypothetical protein